MLRAEPLVLVRQMGSNFQFILISMAFWALGATLKYSNFPSNPQGIKSILMIQAKKITVLERRQYEITIGKKKNPTISSIPQ